MRQPPILEKPCETDQGSVAALHLTTEYLGRYPAERPSPDGEAVAENTERDASQLGLRRERGSECLGR